MEAGSLRWRFDANAAITATATTATEVTLTTSRVGVDVRKHAVCVTARQQDVCERVTAAHPDMQQQAFRVRM